MKFSVGKQKEIPQTMMRRVGYKLWVDRTTGKRGYIRRISNAFYPRFHAHVLKDKENNIYIDLHLDARKPLHKLRAHSSESDSAVVKSEVDRIINIIA
ncbi:MAG: hypothetical protein ABIE68_00285 [bacterium]